MSATQTLTMTATQTADAPAAPAADAATRTGRTAGRDFVDAHGKTVDVRLFVDRLARAEGITKTEDVRNTLQGVVQTVLDTMSSELMDLLQHTGRQQVSVDHIKTVVKIVYAQQPDLQAEFLGVIDEALTNYESYQEDH